MELKLESNILNISYNFFEIRKSKRKRYKKKRYFAYLNEQSVSDVNMLNANFSLLTDRGYTGHEHFFELGIIHMNGRIYDPMLRTFLSPDPFIQDPNNSQNYNRFGYAFGNPLMYTDPSGNSFLEDALGIFIFGSFMYQNVIVPISKGAFSWGGLAKAVIIQGTIMAISAGFGGFAPIGILPGFGFGVATGAFVTALNSLFTGEPLTLKGIITGAIIGGITGGISGGIQASKQGANLFSGKKVQTFTEEDFANLNITETNSPQEYSDATLNKMYSENFQKPVATMAGGNDKNALKYMGTNNVGNKLRYPTSPDGGIWVGKSNAYAVTEYGPWSKQSKIIFSKAAFASKERLAATMAHELGHVTHNYLGLNVLANKTWDYNNARGNINIDNYGHGAIYEMEYKFNQYNKWIPTHISLGEYQGMPNLGELSSSIEYLGNIKIK